MAEFNHIVRILSTDLDGNKKTVDALRKLHGVSFMYANAVCFVAGVPRGSKAGELTPAQIQRLEDVVKTAEGMPVWLKNRRKDYETGADKHILGTDLNLTQENDIKRLKKVKAYRGIRHMHGQPSRGQRTKSNFRRNKGKHKTNKK